MGNTYLGIPIDYGQTHDRYRLISARNNEASTEQRASMALYSLSRRFVNLFHKLQLLLHGYGINLYDFATLYRLYWQVADNGVHVCGIILVQSREPPEGTEWTWI